METTASLSHLQPHVQPLYPPLPRRQGYLVQLSLEQLPVRICLCQGFPVQLLDLPNFFLQLLRLGARIGFETVVLLLKGLLFQRQAFGG